MHDKKDLLFSLTAKDFKVEFFTASVKAGGGGKDTSNTACRITHPDSGAIGQCQNHRSQLQNKKEAFQRLLNNKKFKCWHRIKCAAALQGLKDVETFIERQVDQAMQDRNLKIESHTEDGWENFGGN